jgi:hypothetical protein
MGTSKFFLIKSASALCRMLFAGFAIAGILAVAGSAPASAQGTSGEPETDHARYERILLSQSTPEQPGPEAEAETGVSPRASSLMVMDAAVADPAVIVEMAGDIESASGLESARDGIRDRVRRAVERFRQAQGAPDDEQAAKLSRKLNRLEIRSDKMSGDYLLVELPEETPFDFYSFVPFMPMFGIEGHDDPDATLATTLGVAGERLVRIYEYVTGIVALYDQGNTRFLMRALRDGNPEDEGLRQEIRRVAQEGHYTGRFLYHMDREELRRAEEIADTFFNERERSQVLQRTRYSPYVTQQRNSLVAFLLMLLKDRSMLEETSQTLRFYRERWRTDFVRDHFYSDPFTMLGQRLAWGFVELGAADVGNEMRAMRAGLDAIEIPGSDAGHKRLPAAGSGRLVWMKDSRSWLPRVEGHPLRYLSAESLHRKAVSAPHPFHPKLIGNSSVSFATGGAAVSGLAETPFVIFSHHVPEEALRELEKELRQYPGYENIRLYRFPSGWITYRTTVDEQGQPRQAVLLKDNHHVDGVLRFIPAAARRSGKPALLVNPYYHAELAAQSPDEFTRFMSDQSGALDIVLPEPQWAHLNLPNAGTPTPSGDFLILNSSPDVDMNQVIERLGLREGHYTVLDPEASVHVLPAAGGALDCVMTAVERDADIIPFSRIDRIDGYVRVVSEALLRSAGGGSLSLQAAGAARADRVNDGLRKLATLRIDGKLTKQDARSVADDLIPKGTSFRRKTVTELTNFLYDRMREAEAPPAGSKKGPGG